MPLAKVGRKKFESKQGFYKLKNIQKYTGKITDGEIPYRSTWEQRCFYYMDNNANIIEWGSETLVIPYVFKLDGKVHKYYPDIICKIKTNDGIKKYIIEIKPLAQTIQPIKPKNRSIPRKQRYESEVATYVKNISKWEAAKEFARKNGCEFIILTEREIYGDTI